MPPLIDLIGKRFHQLEVIAQAASKSGHVKWKCRCDCGSEVEVPGGNLRNGHTKSCGCRQRNKASVLHKLSKVKPGAAFRYVLRSYKNSARLRNLNWELTDEEFLSISQQPCFFTGRLPSTKYTAMSGEEFVYNGIDRLDNSKGYTLENSVPCCSDANYAKRDMSLLKFRDLVNEIYNHTKGRIWNP